MAFILLSGVAVLGVVALWPFSKPNPMTQPAAGQNHVAENTPEATVDAPPDKQDKPPAAKSPEPSANGQTDNVLEPKDKLKQEYTRFAEQFSMRTDLGYLSEFRLDAPRRASAAKALNLSQPALAKAAGEFGGVAVLYATAQKVLDGATFTPEEVARMQQLGREGFEGDDQKMKEYLGKAFTGLAKEYQASQISAKLLDEAMRKHAASWKAVALLARTFAGPAKADTAVLFEFSTVRQLPMQYGLQATNTSGRTLTNVTLAVESHVSSTLQGDARKNYVFLREWKKNNGIGIYYALVDTFPHPLEDAFTHFGAPRPTKNCLTYSLWSDQMSQEDVVLDMGCPEPKLIYPNAPQRRPEFLRYAFHKQGEPQYDSTRPDLFVVGSVWRGKSQHSNPYRAPPTRRNICLIVTARDGESFKAEVKAEVGRRVHQGVVNMLTSHLCDIEGTVARGAIKWRDAPPKRFARGVPGYPTEGEINGTRIEATYSGLDITGRHPINGFVSLEYVPKDKNSESVP